MVLYHETTKTNDASDEVPEQSQQTDTQRSP